MLRYDTRGFGESVTEAVTFSNRADLLALMDHLKIDKAVIVGNSRGGQIAVDFALENPSRVSGLVFVAGGLSGFDKTPADVNKTPTAGEKAVFEKIGLFDENFGDRFNAADAGIEEIRGKENFHITSRARNRSTCIHPQSYLRFRRHDASPPAVSPAAGLR